MKARKALLKKFDPMLSPSFLSKAEKYRAAVNSTPSWFVKSSSPLKKPASLAEAESKDIHEGIIELRSSVVEASEKIKARRQRLQRLDPGHYEVPRHVRRALARSCSARSTHKGDLKKRRHRKHKQLTFEELLTRYDENGALLDHEKATGDAAPDSSQIPTPRRNSLISEADSEKSHSPSARDDLAKSSEHSDSVEGGGEGRRARRGGGKQPQSAPRLTVPLTVPLPHTPHHGNAEMTGSRERLWAVLLRDQANREKQIRDFERRKRRRERKAERLERARLERNAQLAETARQRRERANQAVQAARRYEQQKADTARANIAKSNQRIDQFLEFRADVAWVRKEEAKQMQAKMKAHLEKQELADEERLLTLEQRRREKEERMRRALRQRQEQSEAAAAKRAAKNERMEARRQQLELRRQQQNMRVMSRLHTEQLRLEEAQAAAELRAQLLDEHRRQQLIADHHLKTHLHHKRTGAVGSNAAPPAAVLQATKGTFHQGTVGATTGNGSPAAVGLNNRAVTFKKA